jgi:hypothetical protein
MGVPVTPPRLDPVSFPTTEPKSNPPACKTMSTSATTTGKSLLVDRYPVPEESGTARQTPAWPRSGGGRRANSRSIRRVIPGESSAPPETTDLTASTSRRAGMSLSRKPTAPAFNAAKTYWSRCRITILVSGGRSLITPNLVEIVPVADGFGPGLRSVTATVSTPSTVRPRCVPPSWPRLLPAALRSGWPGRRVRRGSEPARAAPSRRRRRDLPGRAHPTGGPVA